MEINFFERVLEPKRRKLEEFVVFPMEIKRIAIDDYDAVLIFPYQRSVTCAQERIEDLNAFVRRLLEIVWTLHMENVYHGDIKPSNMVFKIVKSPLKQNEKSKKEDRLALIDFDCATTHRVRKLRRWTGTEGYLAPELEYATGESAAGEEETYDVLASDLYSCGVSIKQLTGFRIKREEESSDDVEALVKQLLDADPQMRVAAAKDFVSRNCDLDQRSALVHPMH